MASGINNTFRQVGIATGIAGLGAIFQHELPNKTHAALAASAPGREVLRGSGPDKLKTALVSGEVQQIAGKLPSDARAALAHAYRVGFTSAFTSILEIAAAIALVGCVLALALVRSRDFVASEPAGASAGQPGESGEPAAVGAA
jgi:hypothetical protein